MIGVIQITSAVRLDTFINVLLNIKILPLYDSSWAYKSPRRKLILHFKKCQGKFHFLVYEMLFIKQRYPFLNTQADWFHSRKALCLRTFHYLLSFLVFNIFYLALFDLIMTLAKRRTVVYKFSICSWWVGSFTLVFSMLRFYANLVQKRTKQDFI